MDANNQQIQSRKTDIKTFLKLKIYNSGEKQYYIINNEKTMFTLFDPIRMQQSDKDINFEMNKIFVTEENSYIYEDICRDVCSEALEGQNFCFITGGASKSGKKTLIYGKEDCKSEFSSRGLLYRLIENFLTIINKNTDLTVSMSMLGVYNNKYVDLVKFIQKNNSQASEKEFVNIHNDIKATQEITNQMISKIQIIEVNDIIDMMNKILEMYKNLDLFDRKLMTRTNFVNNLLIYKNGKLISTVSFCTLSGNEKIGLGKEFDGQKTRDSISNLNNEEALINIITLLKQSEADENKIKEIPFQENPLTFCIKRFLINAKLRIISCIFPGTGYINIVKNTLMFPFRIRKALIDLRNIKKEIKPEQKRDEEIYQLELQLKNQQKTIEKLKNDVQDQKKENENKEKTYKHNLEIIKKAFNFEGEVTKLVENDETVKEAIYARKIRDSGDQVRYLSKKILELEKKIEDLKEDNRTLERERGEKKLDIAMVTLYNKLKEDNLLEENKIKIMLEHGKTVEKLKNENQQLTKQLENYKKEMESKSKLIKSLPSIMTENFNEKKKYSESKEELKNQLEKNYFDNINKLKESHIKDINYCKNGYENNIKHKNDEISQLKNEIKEIKMKFENDMKQYIDESFRIYDNYNTILSNYKKFIDLKKIKNIGMLGKAKEDLDVIVDNVNRNINRTQFPLLYNLLDEKDKTRFSKSTNAFFKEKVTTTMVVSDPIVPIVENKTKREKPVTIRSNIDQSNSASEISQEYEKIKPKKIYTYEELEKIENNMELINIIFSFQQKIKEIENFNENIKNNIRKIVPPKDEEEIYKYNLLDKENSNLRKKLEEQLKINFNNKMIMESQERIIERHNTNNFLVKNVRPSTGITAFTDGTVSSPKNKRTFSATTKNSVKFRPSTGRPLTSKENMVIK
jgi:hypothetical protein